MAACTPPARRNSFATFAVVAFKVSDAPKVFACASFSSETSIAVTDAPSRAPICTASCPRPPTPKNAKRWPGWILACCRARYTVTPAQKRGAASLEESCSGIFSACLAGALTNSAYPPSTVTPVICCLTQRFSLPSRQNAHSPQVQCTQGTPTRSPTSNCLTEAPFSTTRPAISCPRINGLFVMGTSCGQSPSARCKSEWHTPQASTSISTSCAAGFG